jgi:hypothetical protein
LSSRVSLEFSYGERVGFPDVRDVLLHEWAGGYRKSAAKLHSPLGARGRIGVGILLGVKMPDVFQERLVTVAGGATPIVLPRAGVRISNSRGVPGTLGCIVRSLADGHPLLLSTWHVLFGRRARQHETVWLVEESDGARRFVGIGNVLYGRIGAIHFDGQEHYVDCAVASCSGGQRLQGDCFPTQSRKGFVLSGATTVQPGCLVRKTGAATGTTMGEVVDVKYGVTARRGAGAFLRQLLIRPAEEHAVFSSEGDSGALVTDARGRAVGLLWGSTSRGEGVASHIGPVLQALNISMSSQVCEPTIV